MTEARYGEVIGCIELERLWTSSSHDGMQGMWECRERGRGEGGRMVWVIVENGVLGDHLQ